MRRGNSVDFKGYSALVTLMHVSSAKPCPYPRKLMTEAEKRPVEVHAVGNLTLQIDKISKVALDNITDLEGYVIVKESGLIIHKMTMRNGGQARISYTGTGKLMAFETQKLTVRVRNFTEITLAVKW
jgi:hypothetical protein